MLFDFGWSELMLIGIVALVVIGPKDLPRALKIAGYWIRKARSMSREFQNSVEQMIREAELDEVRDELKKVSDFRIEEEFRNTIDPQGELSEALHPAELADYSSPAPMAAAAGEGAAAEPRAIETAAAAPQAAAPVADAPPQAEPAAPQAAPTAPGGPDHGAPPQP